MQVKYTAIVAEASGKLNGTVFSRNAYGSYARTKVTPTNPQTQYQMAVRAQATALTQYWQSLDDSQRAAWVEFGKTYGSTNPFGDMKKISGIAAFVRSNSIINLIGDTQVDDCPDDFSADPLTVTALTVVAATGKINVTFTPTPGTANQRILVYATPKISGAKMSVENQLRMAVYSVLAAASPQALDYPVARLGGIAIGNRVLIKVCSYNRTNGQVAAALSEIVTVT